MRRLTLDDLYDFQIPSAPAISPDGERIAYVVRTTDRSADEDRHHLWLVPASGGEPVRLTGGKHDSAPAWSPDGRQIAFLRRDADGRDQVWVMPVYGGEAEQLTSLAMGTGAPQWSHDGAEIAFAAPVAPAESRSGAPVVVDRLGYKADGVGLLKGARTQLFVVEVSRRETRQVTRADVNAREPAWSPDDNSLAFVTGLAGDGEATQSSAAAVVDLTSPDLRPTLIGPEQGKVSSVTWTPDGSALLLVGRGDLALGNDRLLRVPLTEGDTVDLTASFDRNVMPGAPGYPGGRPQVTPDGRTVLFCARDGGCTALYAVDPRGGTVRAVVSSKRQSVSGLSVASGIPRAATILASPASYGEVCVVDLNDAAERILTDHTARALPEVEHFVGEARTFTISDGTRVHGWVLRDPDAPNPGPLLVDAHGGPHNAWQGIADPVHAYHQILLSQGWSVLLLNPRGSDGYGEDFLRGAIGAWGMADERDLLEPITELVDEGFADASRLALTGYSYGGYVSCWLTSRTDMFRAAVAGGVVSDLVSFAGTSDAGHMVETELSGTVHQDREHLAAHSPITRVAAVRTPTLILHGAADERCPVGQAEQWFAALCERQVPTQLVLYPDGGHLFILDGKPSHRIDYNRRVIDWVTQHTASSPVRRPLAVRDTNTTGSWQDLLTELAAKHQVPGAVLGIAHGDEIIEAKHGVLNHSTGVEVTTDSLFQIGSITKAWTATLVMQLVDDGKLALDTPLSHVLPELTLADPEVTQRLTMRHLLSHTSGIDGDVITDTGRGDDCLERYVAELAGVAQNHPLGATMSYCNSGFTLAGRAIERLTGETWDAVIAERIFKPLGLTHTVTLPEDAIRFRTAHGHVGEPGEKPSVANTWQLPRSAGPAGLISSTARDVLTFARIHMSSGHADSGTRLLAQRSVAAMREPQVELPGPFSLADAWGLGWGLMNWDGHQLIGHDGGTIGQYAFLRISPEDDLAVVLLTNGGRARDLYADLFSSIFHARAGIEMPRQLEPPIRPVPVELTPYAGVYERAGARLTCRISDGTLHLTSEITGDLAALVEQPSEEYVLTPVRDGLFLTCRRDENTCIPVTFYSLPDGSPYVHMSGRATPKVV